MTGDWYELIVQQRIIARANSWARHTTAAFTPQPTLDKLLLVSLPAEDMRLSWSAACAQ